MKRAVAISAESKRRAVARLAAGEAVSAVAAERLAVEGESALMDETLAN